MTWFFFFLPSVKVLHATWETSFMKELDGNSVAQRKETNKPERVHFANLFEEGIYAGVGTRFSNRNTRVHDLLRITKPDQFPLISKSQQHYACDVFQA